MQAPEGLSPVHPSLGCTEKTITIANLSVKLQIQVREVGKEERREKERGDHVTHGSLLSKE